jgi:hypothetical protein
MIDFLTANWFWLVLAAAFLWMHTRGGGCGMHGSHGGHGAHRSEPEERVTRADSRPPGRGATASREPRDRAPGREA